MMSLPSLGCVGVNFLPTGLRAPHGLSSLKCYAKT